MKLAGAALLLVGLAAGAKHPAVLALRRARISPKLDPTSDKKFFDGKKADYPTDDRPVVNSVEHFSHPFPEVQDSNDYSKDYVKDENGDGGEYDAQTAYDRLRIQLAKQREAVDAAKAAAAKSEEELKAAEAAAKEAAKKVADAGEKVEDANKAEEKDIEESGIAKDKITGQTNDVEKEIKDLENCQEQLKLAKEKLEKAIAERKDAQETYAKAAETEAKAAAAAAAAKAEEKTHEQHIAEERAEHAVALKEEEQKKGDLAKMEKQLEEASKKVRTFRDADNGKGQNGGVYRKNGAAGSSATLPLAAIAAALAAQLWC